MKAIKYIGVAIFVLLALSQVTSAITTVILLMQGQFGENALYSIGELVGHIFVAILFLWVAKKLIKSAKNNEIVSMVNGVDINTPRLKNKNTHIYNGIVYPLGIANNLFFPLVFFVSSVDSSGGVITIYALIFFIPQLVLFSVASAYFIYISANTIFKQGWKVFTNRDIFYISSYLVTLSVAAWLMKSQGLL